ncbi:MAG: hypothetical protein HOO67_03330 [Candidatus Peribacteraceae bacterium]|nr:hypothetical protein [Candidatus Peribacteraceae bacterium]
MKTSLLWNTYARDIEWFGYSVRSFQKYARGFNEAVCFVPSRDRALFHPICEGAGIKLRCEEEWPGAGFLFHEFWQCSADQLCEGDVIFHIDADTCFARPVTPLDWMKDGKIVVPFKRFADYDQEFGPKMWKPTVDIAIGGDVQLSTMITPPYVHYREVYEVTRASVTDRHPEGFRDYVRSCKNDFPQTFCEFETLGATAQNLFHNDYRWHDVDKDGNPFRDYVAEGWSHGGLDLVTDRFCGLTARQKFASIGL